MNGSAFQHRQRVARLLAALGLAWWAGWAVSPAAPAAEAEGSDLFDALKVIRLKVRIDAAGLASLEEAPYSYVPAEVEEGGRIYPNVGLHLKGARTFRPVDKKPSLTIKFNEYLPKQQFHGLRKLLLNNAIEEKTYVQECLGQALFRAVGTPGPRVGYARVELNGRDLGLYVMVEGLTKDFIEANFGSANGNLYEGVEDDVDGKLEQDYGKRSRQEDLRPLVVAALERDRSKRFEQLSKVLNLDQFVAYVALESLINVWDGYTVRRNNYRVYCDHTTGRVTFIPHGLDNFFLEHDWPLLPQAKGMVSAAVLDTPEGRKLYLQKLQEIAATVLRREDLHRRVDAIAAVARPVLTELGQSGSHTRALATYHKRIDRRLDFIAAELPGLLSGKARKKPSP